MKYTFNNVAETLRAIGFTLDRETRPGKYLVDSDACMPGSEDEHDTLADVMSFYRTYLIDHVAEMIAAKVVRHDLTDAELSRAADYAVERLNTGTYRHLKRRPEHATRKFGAALLADVMANAVADNDD